MDMKTTKSCLHNQVGWLSSFHCFKLYPYMKIPEIVYSLYLYFEINTRYNTSNCHQCEWFYFNCVLDPTSSSYIEVLEDRWITWHLWVFLVFLQSHVYACICSSLYGSVKYSTFNADIWDGIKSCSYHSKYHENH